MPRSNITPTADRVLVNINTLHKGIVSELIDEHNVNLHCDDDGFEPLDRDDEWEGLTIMDEIEFFETYIMN